MRGGNFVVFSQAEIFSLLKDLQSNGSDEQVIGRIILRIDTLDIRNYSDKSLNFSPPSIPYPLLYIDSIMAIRRSPALESIHLASGLNLYIAKRKASKEFGSTDNGLVIEDLPNLTTLSLRQVTVHCSLGLRRLPKLEELDIDGWLKVNGSLVIEDTSLKAINWGAFVWGTPTSGIVKHLKLVRNRIQEFYSTISQATGLLLIDNTQVNGLPISVTFDKLETANNIELAGVAALSMSSLKTVWGDFKISNSSQVSAFSLDALETVGGNFTVEGLLSLVRLGLENLKSVGRTLDLKGFTRLRTLWMTLLESIGGSIEVQAPLASLELSSFQKFGSRFDINSSGGMLDCPTIKQYLGTTSVHLNNNFSCVDHASTTQSLGGDSGAGKPNKAGVIGGIVSAAIMLCIFLVILWKLKVWKRWKPKIVPRVHWWLSELDVRPRLPATIAEADGNFYTPLELEADMHIYELGSGSGDSSESDEA